MSLPKVLVAILAKEKAPFMPLYLAAIEALDYDKQRMVVYIRTNNNKDRTREILLEWAERVGPLYAAVEVDDQDVPERVEDYAVHEWNVVRFKVLAEIRNVSLRKTFEHGCDYYFVSDVDNFVRPCTLKTLVSLALPVVAPFLRHVDPTSPYSNYHAAVDDNGYFKGCPQYGWIFRQEIRGIVEVPVVHCTYLVRADVIDKLTYEDESGRYEYVIFSDSARRSGTPQLFDNRLIYGYLTFGVDDVAAVEASALAAGAARHEGVPGGS